MNLFTIVFTSRILQLLKKIEIEKILFVTHVYIMHYTIYKII
jgi:hypothetical protein